MLASPIMPAPFLTILSQTEVEACIELLMELLLLGKRALALLYATMSAESGRAK